MSVDSAQFISGIQFDRGAPLRLSVAAKVAFPDGSMTQSGLRREAGRGRLAIERIAGKDYTTLAEIDKMREKCRRIRKGHTYGSEKSEEAPTGLSAQPHGSFAMGIIDKAQDALASTLEGLSTPLGDTSRKSTLARRPKSAAVIPLKSR